MGDLVEEYICMENPHVLKKCTSFEKWWWQCLSSTTWEGQMPRTELGSWLLALEAAFMGCFKVLITCTGNKRIVRLLAWAVERECWWLPSHFLSSGISRSLDLALFIWHGRFSQWYQHDAMLSDVL
jgi:hypothetical protein